MGGSRKKKAREAVADGETIVPMGLFIAHGEEDESVARTGAVFHPGI